MRPGGLMAWTTILIVVATCVTDVIYASHNFHGNFHHGRKVPGPCGRQTCDLEVVPEVIPEEPPTILHVRFPSRVEARCGNVLTPRLTKDMPEVRAHVDVEMYFTLAVVDPDVPSRENPVQAQFLHWLVVNIPGSGLLVGNVSGGDTKAEYVPPLPPNGTGLHRYVYLAYQQASSASPDNSTNTTFPGTEFQPRYNFSIARYAAENDLRDANAGNLFLAQYDAFVDEYTSNNNATA